MRSYSSRVIVWLVAFVESSTTKVDLVLRESTRALTTTLSNSVSWLLGIFSVSSRTRAAVGLNSACAALTSYTTTAPPRWRKHTPHSACGVHASSGSPKYARTRGIDLGSVPRPVRAQNIPLRMKCWALRAAISQQGCGTKAITPAPASQLSPAHAERSDRAARFPAAEPNQAAKNPAARHRFLAAGLEPR